MGEILVERRVGEGRDGGRMGPRGSRATQSAWYCVYGGGESWWKCAGVGDQVNKEWVIVCES